MPYRQEVKERAYQIDPECWKSYSGKPKAYKQVMERRREDALRRASKELPPPEEDNSLEKRVDALERKIEEMGNG